MEKIHKKLYMIIKERCQAEPLQACGIILLLNLCYHGPQAMIAI
jgi:hypothetical protein